jgi:hypothetical protein
MGVHRVVVVVAARRPPLGDQLEHSAQVHDTEQDQHEPDGELHRQPDPGRDDPAEQDDAASDHQDSQGVPQAPERADQRRSRRTPVAGHDGRHRDDMIGVGGVAHAEEEPQRRDRKEAGHGVARFSFRTTT